MVHKIFMVSVFCMFTVIIYKDKNKFPINQWNFTWKMFYQLQLDF